MKLFFRFALFYLVFSCLVAALIRQQGFDLLIEAGVATYAFAYSVARVAILMIPLLLAIPLFMGWKNFVAKIGLLGYALFASVILQTGFSLIKTTIPLIVPFYADRALADLDRWMHGGVDPWVLAYKIGAYLPMDYLLPAYLTVWVVPALGLALILAIADHDTERRARFLILYLFCWLFIGNVLAMIGSSVGPVFYDALLGGDRFAGLHAALEQSGVTDGRIGFVQDALWNSYVERGMAVGTGISAFPSVHVAIATLTALYMIERSRWLAVPALAFLVTIQFLSVYTGYHYALDGYVSAILMVGAWAVLRRVELTTLGARWGQRGASGLAASSQS